MHDQDQDSNPWRTLSRDPIYENPWIQVTHHTVLKPNGDPGIYGLVHFRNHAVGVVPVDPAGFTWLVGQYRYPLQRYSWEIPEGGVPAGEDPAAGALRELREETGLTAARLIPIIGRVALSNSVSDEEGTLYVAWDLTQGDAEPDDTEELRLRRVRLRDALSMVLAGEITDSLSMLALLRLPLLMEAADTPEALRMALRAGLGP
ncbi:DNA mismatch repair protein MutT [Niveispirillum lacus]|uniref:GDP-mannose pyrophosphatase n=1 Tax=Niveispirillum lacus TaxID=1981099 RepID=A0A255YX18_9PROT|nr:NUDIX hydrolase [Niveispirillum lacus]OYQ33776.1 DNA mismatch repair protein MutT [Niveispirillum lacus]